MGQWFIYASMKCPVHLDKRYLTLVAIAKVAALCFNIGSYNDG